MTFPSESCRMVRGSGKDVTYIPSEQRTEAHAGV